MYYIVTYHTIPHRNVQYCSNVRYSNRNIRQRVPEHDCWRSCTDLHQCVGERVHFEIRRSGQNRIQRSNTYLFYGSRIKWFLFSMEPPYLTGTILFRSRNTRHTFLHVVAFMSAPCNQIWFQYSIFLYFRCRLIFHIFYLIYSYLLLCVYKILIASSFCSAFTSHYCTCKFVSNNPHRTEKTRNQKNIRSLYRNRFTCRNARHEKDSCLAW